MKYYITRNPENGAFGGCISNVRPLNTIGEAPLDNGQFPIFDDLDIVEVDNSYVITVNADKKAARIAAKEAIEANRAAKAYLASTDWYIIREMDTGEPCPQEIKTARAAARAQIT